ncbi:MAG: hypothetical protein AAFQ21_08485 [Pseudomonadota bacterium]
MTEQTPSPTPEPRPLSPEEDAARKRRNIWLALALVGFVALVAIVTMVRIGSGIPERM